MLLKFVLQCLFLLPYLNSINTQNTNPPETHWDYQREGPDAWHHLFDTCEGDAQSPIDIRTPLVKYDSSLPPLILNGYATNMSSFLWNLTHNGHTIVAYPPPLARLSMSGGGLIDTYYLVQFHLHWGYNAFQGSEHTINGRKYPLEIHFFHRAPFTGAFAVLSIMFDRQRDDNIHLNGLLSAVNRTVNSSTAIEQSIDLSRILPTYPPRFYRYNGSLTTPPCTEGVIWTVLARTIPISAYQLRAFENNIIPFNFRPDTHEGGEEGESEGGHHSSASSNHLEIVQLILLCFACIAPILQ